MTKRQVIFGILAIAVMVMIFGFSAKNADESTEESLEVGMTIGKVTVKDFKKLPYPEQVRFAEKIDHMVRKSAHFLEYTVLGFILFFNKSYYIPSFFATSPAARQRARAYSASSDFTATRTAELTALGLICSS